MYGILDYFSVYNVTTSILGYTPSHIISTASTAVLDLRQQLAHVARAKFTLTIQRGACPNKDVQIVLCWSWSVSFFVCCVVLYGSGCHV